MKSWVIYSCLILEDGFVRNCEFVISCWYGEICSGYVDLDDNAIVNDKERQSCHDIETRQLICFANQLTGFYMMGTLVFNELNRYYLLICEILSHMNLLHKNSRNTHRRFSTKECVLKNFAKLTGKHLCQSLLFNNVAGLWHRCFPVNFLKFLIISFL